MGPRKDVTLFNSYFYIIPNIWFKTEARRLRKPIYTADIIFFQKIVNNVNCVHKKRSPNLQYFRKYTFGLQALHLYSTVRWQYPHQRLEDCPTWCHSKQKFICLKIIYFPLHWRGDRGLKVLCGCILAENHFVWWISTHHLKEPAPFVGVSNNVVFGRTKKVLSCALCSAGKTPVRQ